ncbi:MAG: poly-beta-1,6-N-acetyl-D-glucosamine N-deacetylase PgaB [Proteobacteria bacterium]|nr:poly-beta-1,6-N-acetyl-D-glucosamine N-deacetylase PgaB [Pseudomonadota bacterium]
MRWPASFIAILLLCLQSLTAHADQDFIAIAYHDVRNGVTANYDADELSISTGNLAAHFAWLKHHGYVPVSINDLVAASAGRRTLPDKAVLLTFDDGLKSVYTDVYPLLKLFNYPAVISVVTDWLDLSPGETTDYGRRQLSRQDFVSWDELRELQKSGLIEIASHSADLHRGIVANPQGNLMPSATSRAYRDNRYESQEEQSQRIRLDLTRSANDIQAALGTAPRVMSWPYGKYNSANLGVAAELGMSVTLTLDSRINTLSNLLTISRILIRENPGIAEFSAELMLPQTQSIVRAVQVDLDYVYDDDPVQQELNLAALVERVKTLQISHIFLQAFADPDGDGAADALYFPNRHLPMRADLFSRVAWQLKTRSNVRVFAWMPLLAFDSSDFDPDWSVTQYSATGARPDPAGEPRLSPFHPDARRVIREIYQDLASHADFDGILLHDDGRLNEYEDASEAAMAVYRQEFGSSFGISRALNDAALGERWSRFKTQALIDFGDELIGVLRSQRPQLKTVRNLFAPAVLDDASEAWLAQSFSLFLEHYDYVALMAMPYLEGSADPQRYLDQLAAAVAQQEGGLERTIFELQTLDWQLGTAIPATTLIDQMRRLRAAGVKHLAYYPDDFIGNRPELEEIRQAISLANYPFRRP